jgi:DNA invertase Pin-like site-specific DNA recombinase
MASLKAGDVVLVTKIDRLGRSTQDLLNLIGDMRKAGANFKSLGDEMLDTTSANGELIFTILAAIATYERRLIEARTGEGRKRAMANGVDLDPIRAVIVSRLGRRQRGRDDLGQPMDVAPAALIVRLRASAAAPASPIWSDERSRTSWPMRV